MKPEWLWWLAAVPLFYAFLLWDERRRRRQMESFARFEVWKAILPGHDPGARARKALFLSISLVFAVFALARPQWGMKEEVLRTTGLDIMVLLDVSNSMEVEDVTPSRLKKAKHWLSSFMDQVAGDRVGVVAFAESSYVAVPLTTDHGYVKEVVDLLSPSSVTAQGTNIGAAIGLARKSLERGAEDLLFSAAKTVTTHAVVVLTDGEDHEGKAKEAAKELAKAGIRLFTVGFGTGKGGPVPTRDANGSLLTYKKDDAGKTVVSQLKPETLIELARTGGGQYWTASVEESETQDLVRELAGMNRNEYAERKRLVYEERFQYPLALCILFLLLEMSVSLTRDERKKAAVSGPAARAATPTALLAALLLGSGLAAPREARAEPTGIVDTWETYQDNEAGIDALQRGDFDEAKRAFGSAQARDPRKPELEYNQGIVQLQEGNTEEAIRRFEGAAKGAFQNGRPELGARALFNLGAAQAVKGDKKAAMKSYLQALETAEELRRRNGGADEPAVADPAAESKLEADLKKNIELLQKQDPPKQQQAQNDQQDPQKKQDQQQQGENQNQNQGDKQDKKDQQAKETGKDKKFKSQKLSPEDAERVMAELGNRERELKAKLGQQRGQHARNPKDW